MDGGEIVEGLRFSGERFGRLYPVLLDKYGNVVDGLHRLEARLIANVCKRSVSAEEKSQMLGELGELYIKAGVKPGAELARGFLR